MSEVLGVHGIWNYQTVTPEVAASALATKWAAFLGVEEERIAVAYYADRLRLGSHGGDAELEALNRALGDQPRELLLAWIAELGWNASEPQGWGAAPLRGLLDWFVQRFDLSRQTVDRFVAAFLSEVSQYLDLQDSGPRQAVRSVVGAAISTHQPRVVVAHSLGSVVAYETLWAYPRLKVDVLVTVGSPLAIPGRVFPVLQPTPVDGRGRKPPGVRKWVNFSDVGDAVAVPKNLAKYFEGVDEDTNIATGMFWTHEVSHYLRNPQVRAGILGLS